MRPIRCAIYTRKSTEEGLEQEFNSLDAQREACAAYILSQRHEGWHLLPDLYDDGGFSGGSLDRPGLQQLLAEVEAGKVDVIVVYKVDRLTRSLADFAKIVEVLDSKGASFVSVTQAFNTTTSMGRLTLNVLLSFAQFEREVTGERIRDKIAASKKKGLWMGGPVPLGYDVKDRKLIVNEAEATTVRHIYAEYLRLGSVPALIDALAAQGIRTKNGGTGRSRHAGGQRFQRGALYHLLRNRLYLGEIVHKGQAYPGEHQPIIDRALWDQVQARLADGISKRRLGSGAAHPSLLTGILFDGLGRRMSPSHAAKGPKRYRYYITHGDSPDGDAPAWRIAAHDLEQLVVARLRIFLTAAAAGPGMVGGSDQDAAILHRAIAETHAAVARLSGTAQEQRTIIQQLVARVDVHEDRVDISVQPFAIGRPDQGDHHGGDIQVISTPAARVRRGHDIRLVVPAEPTQPEHQRDEKLVALVAGAARHAVMAAGEASMAEIATKLGRCRGHLADQVRLSYLAPDIVEAILEGRQPISLTRRKLMSMRDLPLDWVEQRRLLGFG